VELYGDRGAFVGDPKLRSEAAWTIDAGARARTHEGSARFGAEVVGFATWARDLIAFLPTGFGVAKAFNVGSARIFGVEAEAHAQWAGVELRASYTGLMTGNESQCASRQGEQAGACERPPLPGRPAHDLVADISYAIGPVRVRYGLDVLSGIHTDLTGEIEAPPRALQSAGLRLDVPGVRGLRVAFDARNIFDVRTATYDGAFGTVRAPIGDLYEYPLPGRSVLFTARYVIPEGG
jgi:outer membrane receptor protein involved in Fe transport